MKKFLPLSLFLCLYAALSHGQDRFAYAITDFARDGVNWSSLRKIDLQTGAFSDAVMTGFDPNPLAFDAVTKKQMTEPLKDPRFGNLANAAFGTGVAAIAYDKKNERLYYTPMLLDQLRYIDLRTMKVYFWNNAGLTGSNVKAADQSNIITRMTFAADGNGYALTNDANSLIQFTTGKKASITNLGPVTDDPANKNISIHTSTTSFGGDMIADDDGNLYVFSARNQVFLVNIETKVATHLGGISGLPATFTANGVAVDPDNKVWISSAVDNSGLYTVDLKTLSAAPASTGSWKTADLANSNLLATRKPMPVAALIGTPEEVPNPAVQLYPNPVTGRQFSIRTSLNEGTYTLRVMDMLGRQTLTQSLINIKGIQQTQNIQLASTIQKGMYLVKLADNGGKTVYSKKILIQ